MLKNKLFQYFFIEFFKILIITSLSLSVLMWMSQSARLLDLVTEYGNSIEVYSKYILLIFPKIYENTFSLSFLVTVFFTFYKLENAQELSIYWLSGVSKYKIIKLVFFFTFWLFLINIFLSTYLAPLSSLKSRMILANSKFNLINSLIKENNFNSPLKGLTIYVNSNNQKGDLKGVFIYEDSRTIIAKKGNVFEDNGIYYLELLEGVTQEKNKNKINTIKFDKTLFDFSKYKMQNITTPKFSERDIFWLIDKIKFDKDAKIQDMRKELNKRTIKPFCLFLLATLGCFLLYDNKEKINLTKFRISVFGFSILLLIANEIFLGISSKNLYYSIGYFLFLLIFEIILIFILIKTLKFETLRK